MKGFANLFVRVHLFRGFIAFLLTSFVKNYGGRVHFYNLPPSPPSVHLCTKKMIRLGKVRLGQVRLGQVRLGQVRLGQVRLGQVRLGQVRLVLKKNYLNLDLFRAWRSTFPSTSIGSRSFSSRRRGRSERPKTSLGSG